MAVCQSHDSLLDIALPPARSAEALDLALAHQRVDAGHLDLEERLDGGLDLGLWSPSWRRLNTTWLFSEAMVDFSVTTGLTMTSLVAKISHLNRSSRASIADFEKHQGASPQDVVDIDALDAAARHIRNVAAARRKFWSISAPPIISALVRPSLAKLSTSAFVLALSSMSVVDDDQCRGPGPWPKVRASDRARETFLGRSIAWLRVTGPWALPPPRNCGARAEE